MAERYSLLLSEILRRHAEAPEPPVDWKLLSLDQKAILRAYGRACSVRALGQEVTVKLVEDYAQDDWGYGVVPRNKVKLVLEELETLGWTFELATDERKKSLVKRRAVRAHDPGAAGSSDNPERAPARRAAEEPRPKSKAEGVNFKPKPKRAPARLARSNVPRVQPSTDDPNTQQLVGEAPELRTVILRNPRPKRTQPAQQSADAEGGGAQPRGADPQPKSVVKRRRRTAS